MLSMVWIFRELVLLRQKSLRAEAGPTGGAGRIAIQASMGRSSTKTDKSHMS